MDFEIIKAFGLMGIGIIVILITVRYSLDEDNDIIDKGNIFGGFLAGITLIIVGYLIL